MPIHSSHARVLHAEPEAVGALLDFGYAPLCAAIGAGPFAAVRRHGALRSIGADALA